MHKIISLYKNLSLPMKAALWFIVCNFIQKAISILTVPLFTRLLTTEQYGVYSLYMSWENIIIIITSLNLFYGAFNKAMLEYPNDRDKYVASMQGLIIVNTLLIFGIYWIFKDYLNKIFDLPANLILLLFLQVLFKPFFLLWTSHKRFEYRYLVFVIATLLLAILNPCLGLLMVLNSSDRDTARVISIVIVEVGFGGFFLIYQFAKTRCFFNKKYWIFALKINLRLLPHYLSSIILSQSDRIMIDYFVGKSETALYSVTYNIGSLLLIFTDAIINAFIPWIYGKIQHDQTKNIAPVLNGMSFMVVCLITLMLFFAPEIMYLFGDKKYMSAVGLIPPITISAFFIYIYVLYSNIEIYYGKSTFILFVAIGAALLNIGLNYLYIPKYGYQAAAYTTLISYFLFALVHYLYLSILMSKNKCYQITSWKKTLLFTIILLVECFAFIYMYQWPVYFRLIPFVLIIVLIIIKRKYFINLLKNLRKKEEEE